MELPRIVLDPQNETEIAQQAYLRIGNASSGKLTDFRPGSPVAALIEGQVFAYAELLYYLNLLPEALALEVFRLSGVQRQAGTKATGQLTFVLSQALNQNFVVNPGYFVNYSDTYFILTEQLVINAGATQGTVTVEAGRVGADLNIPGFTLLVTAPDLNYVQSIYNADPFTGGTDLEPLSNTITRAQTVLRSRNVLVSQTDYELATQEILGANSRAVAVPFLTADKLTSNAVGQVHVFCCTSLGTAPSAATLASIKDNLLPRVYTASQVWVSAVEFQDIDISVEARVSLIDQTIADDMAANIQDYLSPLNYTWGDSVLLREVLYRARDVEGVQRLLSWAMNGATSDITLPNRWTTPRIDTLTIKLTQADGLNQTWVYGNGLGDSD
jgi:uncharacterized phage protein gp47/JayE